MSVFHFQCFISLLLLWGGHVHATFVHFRFSSIPNLPIYSTSIRVKTSEVSYFDTFPFSRES